MPTTVTHTIKASGGDYTSLASWEAAQQRNLVSLDEIAVAECYPFVDVTTSTTLISGWTTGINNYIEIRAHPSAKATLPMTTDGSRYLLRVNAITAATGLLVQQEYTRVYDIQVENVSSGANQNAIAVTGNGDNVISRNCVARGTSTTTWFFQGVSARIQNCVAINTDTGRAFGHDNAVVQYDNCTAIFRSTGVGFRVNANTVNSIIFRNCLSVNLTANSNCYVVAGTGLSGTGAIDLVKSTNNVSNDATALGVNPLLNQRPIFANAAIQDYHLDWMDAVAQRNGVNLSASDTGSFSDDFDGNTRTTWHIGAAGVSNVPGVVRVGSVGNSTARLDQTGPSNIRIT